MKKHNYQIIEDDFSSFKKVDCLSRRSYAEELAKLIQGTQTKEKSFAIGIVGNWGSGKTVFLELIKKKLISENNDIIINFNPWRSSSPKAIFKDFFLEFSDKLKDYYPGIYSKLNRYSEALKKIDENFYTKSLHTLLELVSPSKTIENLYVEISDTIRNKINKRIIIFIDDLDRLTDDEIMHVLKIVRNTANFPKTFFIVAYDQKYILSVISKKNPWNYKNYLEKIFQIEIPLPNYPNTIIYQKTLELLAKGRSEIEFKEIENLLNSLTVKTGLVYDLKEMSFFDFYIRNLRDVIRFVNSFNINYNIRRENVDIIDFVLLEFVKLKYLHIYNLIKERRFIENDLMNLNSGYKFNKDEFDKYLKTDKSNLSDHKDKMSIDLDDEEIESITKTFNYLFNDERQRSINTIKDPYFFIGYFSPEFFSSISMKEFNDARKSEIEIFFRKIDEWALQGKANDVGYIFFKIINFENKNDFEKMIEAMIYLSKYNILYLRQQIFTILNKVEYVIKTYYNNNIKEYKSFLISIFIYTKEYCFIKSFLAFDFLYSIIKELTNFGGILSKKELQEIIFENFKKYIDETDAFNISLYELYYLNYDNIDPSTNRIIISDKANNLMLNIIKKYPKEFIKTVIRLNGSEHDGVYTLEPFIPQIFGSFDEFETFLFSLDDKSTDTLEAKAFYRNFAAYNYQPIPFKRRTIEFVSDEQTTFFDYKEIDENLITGDRCISFEHDGHKKIIEKYPVFKYYKFIAHKEEISDNEATHGGTYILRRKINLPIKKESISNANIIFFVDDECKIQVNGKYLFPNFEKTEDKYITEDIFKYLNDEENTFLFEILNYDSMKSGHNGKNITFKQNVYGIAYSIIIEFEDQINIIKNN